MSYIISEKQYLLSDQSRYKYVPYKIRLDAYSHEESEVAFGHPLYTFIADFLELSPSTVEEQGQEYEFPIIPDGCASIIILIKGDEIRGYLCGVVDQIHKIVLQENEIAFIARYLPGGLCSFLQESMSEYTNGSFSLTELFPNYEFLFSEFTKAATFPERLHAFTKIMRTQHLNRKEAHYVLNYCVNKIFDRRGNIKIAELAKETGFSERYIGKLFDQWVGISPKLYAEIMRFQYSLEKLEQYEKNESGILLDTALDSGFFDHAHMNRCYRRFLHCTTGKLSKLGFTGMDLSTVANLIP